MTFLTLAWPVSTHCYVDSGFQCQSDLYVLSLKSKLIRAIKIEIELVKISSFNNELNDSIGHMIRITWIKQKWTSHFMLMRTLNDFHVILDLETWYYYHHCYKCCLRKLWPSVGIFLKFKGFLKNYWEHVSKKLILIINKN